jgi:hypothetical protein
VRALASSGDTANRSESGTSPFCPNSFISKLDLLRGHDSVADPSLYTLTYVANAGACLVWLRGVDGHEALQTLFLLVAQHQGNQTCCTVRLDRDTYVILIRLVATRSNRS